MSLPRMRTAEKALAVIRGEDPETDVTLHYIRQLIKTGRVPSVAVGRKKLVNVELLMAYIAEGGHGEDPAPHTGEIRRVPEQEKTMTNQKKKAALGADNTQSGKEIKTQDCTSIVHEAGEGSQG